MIIYDEKKTYRPSDVYLTQPDFVVILNDIAEGKLPTGSQRPFPLFVKKELQNPNEFMYLNQEPIFGK